MRYRLLISAIAIPLLFYTVPSQAQFVVACPTCASLTTQLWEKAQQAAQYAKQLEQLQTEIQSKIALVQGATALPQSVWANVTGDIYAVRNLTNAASLLTGNSGSILSRLQSAQGYANQAAYLPSNIGQQFSMWQQTLGQADNALGRTLGLQQNQMNNDAILQRAVQAHSQSAVGQMQVMQAGVEMAGITNYNLQQIQTTLTATAEAQAARDLVVADRQGSEDAAMQRMLTPTAIPTTGYRGY